jgi:hypothetical protein
MFAPGFWTPKIRVRQPYQPRLWYGCHHVPEGTRPTMFGRKLDSEDEGEHPREAESITPFVRGQGTQLSMELPIRGA